MAGPTIRAKFQVIEINEGVNQQSGEKFGEEVKMIPVYSPDPNHENHTFWRATPSGELRMYIENPSAFGTFRRGQEYLVDFTPA